MIYKSYAICGPGLVRSENQDNLYVNGAYRPDVTDFSEFRHETITSDLGLFAVADGMGGEKHGELASLITVSALNSAEHSSEGLQRYLLERNDTICELSEEMGGSRIGSTYVGINIIGNDADILNIGDSRIYLFRQGTLTQLSYDHTSAQRMIDLGMLDKVAAAKHPDKHKLTQHMGISPTEFVIEPYRAHLAVLPGDVFLLCSDGLTDMLDDQGIESILTTHGDIQDAAENLYATALQNGGRDNTTVILVQAENAGVSISNRKRVSSASSPGIQKQKIVTIALCVVAIVLVTAVVFTVIRSFKSDGDDGSSYYADDDDSYHDRSNRDGDGTASGTSLNDGNDETDEHYSNGGMDGMEDDDDKDDDEDDDNDDDESPKDITDESPPLAAAPDDGVSPRTGEEQDYRDTDKPDESSSQNGSSYSNDLSEFVKPDSAASENEIPFYQIATDDTVTISDEEEIDE